MNSKYKIAIIISVLLIILSVSISTINYIVSSNNTQKQLKDQSLPLSLDNIYTEIQKHLIEPYLVSSMMANNTFVQDWIMNEEKNHNKIEKYLNTIKNKYGLYTTFLVSENSNNYYTQNGFIEEMKKTNETNKWYYKFKQTQGQHEINLDLNEHLSNSLMMFINYKIFDKDYSLLGATGIGLKISYIDDMLKMFRQKYKFRVFFLDEKGDVILYEHGFTHEKNISNSASLQKYKDQIISKEPTSIEYKYNNDMYLLNSKYIPELNLYLLVEAKVDDFIENVKKTYYFNLFISLFISLIITIIIILLIRNYNKKLEYLAGNDLLTNINNRRAFEEKLEHHILLHKRNKQFMCIAFLDIDNFKKINDDFGHTTGDRVLQRIAVILKENTRQTDLLARWGGEEFVIAYIDSSIQNVLATTEKLKNMLANDYILKELNEKSITGSFGITELKEEDSLDSMVNRADNAMYKSKKTGKNKITVID